MAPTPDPKLTTTNRTQINTQYVCIDRARIAFLSCAHVPHFFSSSLSISLFCSFSYAFIGRLQSAASVPVIGRLRQFSQICYSNVNAHAEYVITVFGVDKCTAALLLLHYPRCTIQRQQQQKITLNHSYQASVVCIAGSLQQELVEHLFTFELERWHIGYILCAIGHSNQSSEMKQKLWHEFSCNIVQSEFPYWIHKIRGELTLTDCLDIHTHNTRQ